MRFRLRSCSQVPIELESRACRCGRVIGGTMPSIARRRTCFEQPGALALEARRPANSAMRWSSNWHTRLDRERHRQAIFRRQERLEVVPHVEQTCGRRRAVSSRPRVGVEEPLLRARITVTTSGRNIWASCVLLTRLNSGRRSVRGSFRRDCSRATSPGALRAFVLQRVEQNDGPPFVRFARRPEAGRREEVLHRHQSYPPNSSSPPARRAQPSPTDSRIRRRE